MFNSSKKGRHAGVAVRVSIFEAVRFVSACTMRPFIRRPGSRPVGAPRRDKLRVFVHAGIGPVIGGFQGARSVMQQLRGFSDIESPPQTEDGCLKETPPNEQQEIKNSILSSWDVSPSSPGSECDIF